MTNADLINNLALEVEVPPTGLANLVPNPDGATGAWGWITPIANTLVWNASGSSPALGFVTYATAQPAYVTTDFMPVAAGQYVSARLSLSYVTPTGHNVKSRFEFYDATKTLISSSTQSSALAVSYPNPTFTPTAQAPAGTAYVKWRLDFYNGTANPAYGAYFTFTNAMVIAQPTGTVTAPPRTNLFKNPSFEVDATYFSANLAQSMTIATTTAQA